MRRRQFLSAAGLATATAAAGCLGSATPLQPPRNPDDTSSEPTPCPSVREHTDRTVCADPASGGPVAFEQNADTVTAGEDFVVELTNEGTDEVGLNPYDWAVHRKAGDDWERVAPDNSIEPWYLIAPGDSLSWHLMVGELHPTPSTENVYIPPLDLDAGEYAFSVVASVDEERAEFVARFAVE